MADTLYLVRFPLMGSAMFTYAIENRNFLTDQVFAIFDVQFFHAASIFRKLLASTSFTPSETCLQNSQLYEEVSL